MVEIEAGKNKPITAEGSTTKIDISQIISKVKDFVDNVKEMAGEPMDVRIDKMNFSLNKGEGEYDLSLETKIVIKPKKD